MASTKTKAMGAFVLGGVLLFAVGLFLIGDRRMLFPVAELTTRTIPASVDLKLETRYASPDSMRARFWTFEYQVGRVRNFE